MNSHEDMSLEEDGIKDTMRALSLTEAQARTWREKFKKKCFANRVLIYRFLKANNPKVAEMEQDEEYQRRFQEVAKEMAVPRLTGAACVITGEIYASGAMR